MSKRLIGFIVLAVCVVVAAGFFVAAMRAVSRSRQETRMSVEIRDQIEMLRRRGEPVDVARLGGSKIPDNQNAAIFYEKAFRALKDADTRQPGAGTVIGDLGTSQRRKFSTDWAKVRAAVGGRAAAVAAVEEAVKPSKRLKCQFHVNWQDGAGALFPHFASLRELARTLRAKAILDAHDGKMAEAGHDIELQLQMSQALRDEPTLIGFLVRIAILRIGIKSLDEVTQYEDLPEVQAKRIFDALGNIDLDRGLLTALKGERAMGIWCFDQTRKKGPGALELHLPINAGPLLDADEAIYLDRMERMIAGASMPYEEAKARGMLVDPDTNIPKWAVVTAIMMPVAARTGVSKDDSKSQLATAQAYLALRAFRSRFGSYPATLGELRDRLGWNVPRDPCGGGRDLVYRPQGKGFIVYSIGPDRKDDGGTPQDTNTSNGPGDIVWKSDK